MKFDGWCLESPQRKLVACTFAPLRDECWEKSYQYLEDKIPEMKQLWTQWKESQELATEKGWVMRKVRVVLADDHQGD